MAAETVTAESCRALVAGGAETLPIACAQFLSTPSAVLYDGISPFATAAGILMVLAALYLVSASSQRRRQRVKRNGISPSP
ncbi:MAG: hypothetical protein AAF675_00530 [Pseudomonadota bacterium]